MLQNVWLWLLAIVAIIEVVLVGRAASGLPVYWAAAAVAGDVAVVAIVFTAWVSLYGEPRSGTQAKGGIKEAIVFSSIVLICLGVLAIIASIERWPVALLWAGAALLGGAFLGLLFGVPVHGATDGTKGAKSSLMAEAAGTISKFLTGAITVSIGSIYAEFKNIAYYLAQCLQCCSATDGGKYNSSLAGGILLYFAVLGFLSGLLIGVFYMKGAFDDPPSTSLLTVAPDPRDVQH